MTLATTLFLLANGPLGLAQTAVATQAVLPAQPSVQTVQPSTQSTTQVVPVVSVSAPQDTFIQALEARLAELERRERERSARERAPLPPARPSVEVTASAGQGLTVSSTDGRHSISIRARIQIRNTLQGGESIALTDDFAIRTARLIVMGNVLDRDLKYYLQLALSPGDFEPDSASPVFDGYLEWTRFRDLQIRVGQFFVPLDRARTFREARLNMVDRPQVVRELNLDRDIGVMFSSTDLFGSKMLGYQIYLGSGDGRNRLTAPALGPLVVGRLVFRPWGVFDEDQEGDLSREKKPRLAIGAGFGYNHATARLNSTFGPAFTLGTTHNWHFAADAMFKYGGFYLFGEFLLRRPNVDALEGTVNGMLVREWTRAGYGYFVQAGLMIHPLMEIVARWEQLFPWTGTDPAFVRTLSAIGNQAGIGFNLYLNGHLLKAQTDYLFEFRDTLATSRHVFRLQLDASF